MRRVNRGGVLILLAIGSLWGAIFGSLVARYDWYFLSDRGSPASHYLNHHLIQPAVQTLNRTPQGKHAIVWGFTVGSALAFAYFGTRWMARRDAAGNP
ncbi:MAG TPA: hypothetical protein VFT29_18395 [Gemmatimonadaceae bacterium]|nr:hypothetical protein [Gemmatimonadaceae bacterium]